MALKLSNNADGLLALAISDSETSLTLRAGHGSRFPALGSGDWFPITVVRASDPSQFEIMRCTARSGDTLTVVRAQEGTSAIAFDAGDVVSLRLTAGTLEENFPQVEGRNAKNLRFSIDSVGGKPELKFKSGNNEETVVRRSDLTTSPTDTTVGRVLTVGSLGLGEPITLTSSDDLNDIKSPGIYRHTKADAPANTPIPEAGIVTVFKGEPGGFVVQEWRRRDEKVRNFQRSFIDNLGVWSSWVEFYHTDNIAQLISDANLVQTSRTISTGTGLTGGGNLSANRTISLATSHIPIGVGQTWQDVTAQRSYNTTYTNTTGRPIMVQITTSAPENKGQTISLLVDGKKVSRFNLPAYPYGKVTASAIVPPGSVYRVEDAHIPPASWMELR